MPNLLQGREVVREFFQAQASAQALFVETDKLIQDETYRNEQVSALLNCRLKLGDTGANVRAAENIHKFLLKKN